MDDRKWFRFFLGVAVGVVGTLVSLFVLAVLDVI
jgi:hypothetical protein